MTGSAMPGAIGAKDIAALLPHTGAMVLIDRVEAWDEMQIRCTADSHHRTDNPLRAGGRLPVLAAIEYGGQAIALHTALNAGGDGIGGGVLASLQNVTWPGGVEDLAAVNGPLVVNAVRLMAGAAGARYDIRIKGGGQTLLDATATVALTARPAGQTGG